MPQTARQKSKPVARTAARKRSTSNASKPTSDARDVSDLRALRDALRAIERGDFGARFHPRARRGVLYDISEAFNAVAERNASLTSELVRVEQLVGREGRMTERVALAPGAAGDWSLCVHSANALIADLMQPTTEIARVIGAVARGDLSEKMALEIEGQPIKGEFLRIGTTVNAMVDQLNAFSAEVTRVAREVGTEGKLGGQARVEGVSGTWKDLTDNVNSMAANLTTQVRGIVRVVTAVANGDLSQKLVVDAKGEIAALADTLNSMTNTLGIFAEQVTSVAKTVGVEGKLGAQAQVPGVAGTWKDLTDNVNLLANNLTGQVRNIAKVTTAVANGDLSQTITVEARGEVLELKDTINTMVDQLNSFASEVTRVAKEVGTEGKLGGQAEVRGVSGTWKDLTDNVNSMAANLTQQVRNIAKVTTAVANGDLSQKITVEARGEVLELKDTINTMVDQLNSFASEVTRVAREVGTEGELGGQAAVQGVAGVWKNLTDNVNFMARNLTTQVRGIVKVVTAVANGDLSQKLLGVEAKGEIAALADTINAMTDTLRTFAEQVSTVAHQVGVEGKLGGQAKVPGATGTWRQLTDNVNQLAGNLTTQVRAIQEVATAVTKGDLTQSIDVEALGEVAQLKDNINQMIINLRETTRKNQDTDWLKTNLARFSSMMQGQKNLETVSQMIMSQLTPLVSAQQGAFFVMGQEEGAPCLKMMSAYAHRERKSISNRFKLGEGLIGQCALEREPILITNVPSDYIQISSGLGEATPLSLIVLPVLFEGEVKAVIELASFEQFRPIHQLFLEQLMESIGVVLNMITANMRTEELLQQSQGLTQELQSQSRELTLQQEELKRSNSALEKQAIELEVKARLLEEQNTKVEIKNTEVEHARLSLEEKAEQLALISKYKSEFLANMSHELRTPLNSLLILARLLADNASENLSAQQVEYAKTIYASGGDLLALINEILDLSKVEAGKMQVEPRQLPIADVASFVERIFRPVAEHKGLAFDVEIDDNLSFPIRTDPQRLQQVLKNLLANAFKFTDRGSVTLRCALVTDRTHLSSETLHAARSVVAFEVSDTGIGIAHNKQKIIFEAFQQADGTTSRRYGGTGLGLSISREIARLLGGEIKVHSVPGKGSRFTLYLPDVYVAEDGTPSSTLFNNQTNGAVLPSPRPATSAIELRNPSPRRQNLPNVVGPTVLLDADSMVSRPVEDDRELILKGDRVLLVIEDDVKFARIMVDMAHEQGFKAVVATRGDTGVVLANEFLPDAITLDIQLPVLDGWAVLARLKRNPRTRHIPVHVMSIVERSAQAGSLGAFAYLEKPVSRDALLASFVHLSAFLDRGLRRVLVVEADEVERETLADLLRAGESIEVTTAGDVETALESLEARAYDCVVVELSLHDAGGCDLIERIKTNPRFRDLPVVVYTVKEVSVLEEQSIARYADALILKDGIESTARLADGVNVLLHRAASDIPKDVRDRLDARARERRAHDFSVLVVDDDVRNIFAMSSILESSGIRVVYAENGRAALRALESDHTIELVLMDIMMPEMDGFETIAAIRNEPRFSALPIVAITAKALPEDRDRCIEGGASDYLPKPVDTDKLLELVELWTRA